jgi:hypothetical protein
MIYCDIIGLNWYKLSEKLTELGWVYFILELMVMGIIVLVKYKSYKNFE